MALINLNYEAPFTGFLVINICIYRCTVIVLTKLKLQLSIGVCCFTTTTTFSGNLRTLDTLYCTLEIRHLCIYNSNEQ